MLPSEYPEVQSYPHLQRLLADHIDMQFEDLRLLLKQPRGRSTVGANFATAALLFNVISGASVCFYKTSWAGFTAKTGSGDKFKKALRYHFPLAGLHPVSCTRFAMSSGSPTAASRLPRRSASASRRSIAALSPL